MSALNLNQIIEQSTLEIETVISVFVCDMNECRISIDVINNNLGLKFDDFYFVALINIDIGISDRIDILSELKKYVNYNTLEFAPHPSSDLPESTYALLEEPLCLGHQEEFISPYPKDANELLTNIIKKGFDDHNFDITFI